MARSVIANRRWRRLRATLVGCLLALLVGCTSAATLLNGARLNAAPSSAARSNAIESSDGAPMTRAGVPVGSVRVLQLNLCDSGIARCYTGRSTKQAATIIRTETPDLVTLNEICHDDLSTLQQALAAAVPDRRAVSVFQPARDRRTGKVYHCRNGQPYGIGIVSRWASVPGSVAVAGIYASQDTDDFEERAWLCLDIAADPTLTVCTTHLAYTKPAVTAAQCRFLFGTVIPELHQRTPTRPVVFGGDLNIGPGDSAELRSCVPAGSTLVDDGGVQHVVATAEFVVSGFRRIDTEGTTDHPGLLVMLARQTRR